MSFVNFFFPWEGRRTGNGGLSAFISHTSATKMSHPEHDEIFGDLENEYYGDDDEFDHPTYANMIKEALENVGQGSKVSYRKICEYISENYRLPSNYKTHVRNSLSVNQGALWSRYF